MLHRTLYASVTQSAVGAAFTATVPETPRPDYVWELTRLAVTIPNYTSGAVAASLYVGQPTNVAGSRFIAGTNQGQNDSAGGRATIVYPGEFVFVVWKPTRVPGIVQGSLTIEVDQLTRAELGRYRGAS